MNGPNPSGLCMCGCGDQTRLAPYTAKRLGWIMGEHIPYVRGHGSRGRSRPLDERYIVEDRGYATPCWIWQDAISHGYGRVWSDGRLVGAHVLYYERYVGPVSDGLHLDHLCRTTACVNPEHLEPVTPAENTRRGLVALLTLDDVREIRRRGGGRPIWIAARELAGDYGVSAHAVYDVLAGRTWVEVPRA